MNTSFRQWENRSLNMLKTVILLTFLVLCIGFVSLAHAYDPDCAVKAHAAQVETISDPFKDFNTAKEFAEKNNGIQMPVLEQPSNKVTAWIVQYKATVITTGAFDCQEGV